MVAEGVGLGAAIDYLGALGMENVRAHERELVRYALERLREVGGVRVIGPPGARRARRGDLVRGGGDPPARRGRPDQPRERLRARRPPLRDAADAPPGRARHRPRLARAPTTTARTSTRWSRRCSRHAKCSRSGDRVDDLYRDYILDHYKRPRNFGELDPHDLDAHDHNPLCGDEMGVHIRVRDEQHRRPALPRPGLRDLAGRGLDRVGGVHRHAGGRGRPTSTASG